MRLLLDGLPLGEVSTSMTINATASTLLALYVAVADERGIPRSALSGTIQNDILKEYIARGTYIYPPRPSMRLIVDTFAWCKAEVPKWNTISICGYHIREAGSDAVQEVAFTLADGIAYVEAAIKAGLDVDEFAAAAGVLLQRAQRPHRGGRQVPRRAAAVGARSCASASAPRIPKSWQLRFHAQTAGSSLQAQQPLVNVVRTTVQALAAMLGGAQSLHTNAFDEALALPTEASARLALRTQQVLAHESGIGDLVDPLGGAYAVEALTARDRDSAPRSTSRSIDEMGGMVAAIEQSWPAARDRAARLRVPARDRDEGEDHRRRERVPGRRAAARRPAAASTRRSSASRRARRRGARRRATGRRRPRRPRGARPPPRAAPRTCCRASSIA